ncbi:MAG TPA: hypothetical protein VNR36_03310 [Pseudolysinimonas sp.]|nr:hypothetical protein [Pseudolysinimonas sp.]
MPWIDQRDVTVQHLALADEAIGRVAADANVSPDVVTALRELRAASVALARLAGAPVPEEDAGR